MKIWLYTVTYNEAKLLPFFLRHYEQFCDRITVFDDNSTDGTQDIIRASPKAALEPYPYKSGLDDRDFLQLASEAYKHARGQADWVIWVDPDEFLYHPDLLGTLAQCLKDGVQVPLTRGFQMISETFPDQELFRDGDCLRKPKTALEAQQIVERGGQPAQIWEIVDEGIEDPIYAKPCIFRPECELRWVPGKHKVRGDFKRGSYAELKVLHYRCLGLEYLRERHARNYARCSKANLDSRLGIGVYPGHQGHMSEPWFMAAGRWRRPVLNHATFHELVRVIHQGQDPYGNIGGTHGTSSQSVLQPTWGGEHPWFHETIVRLKPQVLIEVGTFLGRSTAHMAAKLRAMGLDSALICVDTWLGDDEHWMIPEVRALLRMEYGRPTLYGRFMGNMVAAGLEKYVVPLPIESSSGARLLARLGVHADLIYINGGHVEGEVYRDLVNYWSLLCPGGAMLADNQEDARLSGWQRDMERFIREHPCRAESKGHKARIWKLA